MCFVVCSMIEKKYLVLIHIGKIFKSNCLMAVSGIVIMTLHNVLLYVYILYLLLWIIIIIISTTMFMVLSSWQSHCESSPGSFDVCRMAPSGRRPKTKPDDLGCESACTGCQKLHHRHLLLLSPKADTHFTVPQRVEG